MKYFVWSSGLEPYYRIAKKNISKSTNAERFREAHVIQRPQLKLPKTCWGQDKRLMRLFFVLLFTLVPTCLYIFLAPELALVMQNEDERQAGVERGSGDMQRKTVCLLDGALSSIESSSNSRHWGSHCKASQIRPTEGLPLLDLGIMKWGIAPYFTCDPNAQDGVGYLASVAPPSSRDSGGSEHWWYFCNESLQGNISIKQAHWRYGAWCSA